MRNLLYILAVLLVLFWAIGLFLYSLGAIIHLILIVAIVFLLIGIAQRGNNNRRVK